MPPCRLLLTSLALSLVAAMTSATSGADAKQPNILLFLIDDEGKKNLKWKDEPDFRPMPLARRE